MILPISELKKIDEFKNIDEEILKRDMAAIEIAIREHTNNNFQKRLIRFEGISKDNAIYGSNPYLKVGDTVEVSQSVNNGLYTVESIEEAFITLDGDIFDFGHNLVTKIEYPADVINGAIELLKWKHDPEAQKGKNGVVSESKTISRLSTSKTYKNYDKSNTIKGFPSDMFGFCETYIKART